MKSVLFHNVHNIEMSRPHKFNSNKLRYIEKSKPMSPDKSVLDASYMVSPFSVPECYVIIGRYWPCFLLNANTLPGINICLDHASSTAVVKTGHL